MSRATASERLMSDAEIHGESLGIFQPQGMCTQFEPQAKADNLVKGWDLDKNAKN